MAEKKPTGKDGDFFNMTASTDRMKVIVPKGSAVASKVFIWTFEDCCNYVRSKGFLVDPTPQAFEDFRRVARGAPHSLPFDYPLVLGVPAKDAQPPGIEWINPENMPRDQLVQGKAFLRITPPKPCELGSDVLGNPISPRSKEEFSRLQLILDADFIQNEDGTIESLRAGQVELLGMALRFHKFYDIKDPTLPEYQNAEFFSEVKVKGELAGSMKWKIHGKMTVFGHWSAPNIEVFGDVIAESGIQTNMQGILKFYGNCRTNFIQMSRVGVAGTLIVMNSILQSEVRVGGNLSCEAGPGAIMGSTVHVFGVLKARRAGSDKGRQTKLEIFKNVENKPSNIDFLAKGTEMKVFGMPFISQEDKQYQTPQQG